MSEPRRASTPRTSVSSVDEFQIFTETLLQRIRDAVDGTVKGVPPEEGQARCFLARSDLDSILQPRPLELLFRGILAKRKPANDNNIDVNIDRYITMTTGTPSRTALLAMLIYQDREELLALFLEWLDGYGDAKIPSDDSMPFKEEDLLEYRVPLKFCRSIIQEQAIFRPITIRQSQHRRFRTTDRLPFVGPRKDIKNGSSGTVFHTEIAPRHWEIKSGDSYVSGNPTQPMVIALKTFREIPGFRDMQEATDDFKIERGILKELRSSNVTHKMIMLDWGSFTVVDDQNHPTSHSLIFELATFSLADFLRDDTRANLYKTKSRLLDKLVDVVEALACLHDIFKTMHLDIKPDNILVFEKGSSHPEIQNKDQGDLIWKLSDFGLARKFGANQRSGHNTIDFGDLPSRSSATFATRPAGVYQAPEIQERNSSQAGRGSDVWSIGCVALMIMAFVCGDPSEVSKLTNCLPVDFVGGGGCQSLFYVRSDSRPWKDVSHYTFEYFDNFSPNFGPIPNTQFQAAVNPRVIEWSNGLVESYGNQPEQNCIVQWFEVIFTSALLINHRKRITAASLRDKLSEVQWNWRSHEVESNNNAEPRVTPTAPRANISGPPRREVIREQEIAQPIVKRKIRPQAIDTVQDRSTAESQRPISLPQRIRDIEPHRHSSSESRETLPRKNLGTVIKKNDADAVRVELDRDIGQLKQPCSGLNILPLHWAISNKAYLALDALLEKCDLSITDQVCRGRTALQLACTNAGDTKALKRISKHHKKFNLPPEVYKENKKLLGAEARKALDELYSLTDRKDAREPREGSIKKKFPFFSWS